MKVNNATCSPQRWPWCGPTSQTGRTQPSRRLPASFDHAKQSMRRLLTSIPSSKTAAQRLPPASVRRCFRSAARRTRWPRLRLSRSTASGFRPSNRGMTYDAAWRWSAWSQLSSAGPGAGLVPTSALALQSPAVVRRSRPATHLDIVAIIDFPTAKFARQLLVDHNRHLVAPGQASQSGSNTSDRTPDMGKGRDSGQSIPGQFKGGPCPALLQPMSFHERSFALTTVGDRADTKRGTCEANTR